MLPRRCVGVWDTVGSVQGQIDALSIKDTNLPPTVQYAFHALALQENREKFLPTLWTIPEGGLIKGQVLKQVGVQRFFLLASKLNASDRSGSLVLIPMLVVDSYATN